MKKVLIITLYSGENEFEECKKSVKTQDYPYVEHIWFENLPNKEAHDKLYNRIMEERSNYDIFIKLDADMVFESSNVVSYIVEKFENNASLDLFSLKVWDFFTNSYIWGINSFSNRCMWNQSEDMLFVDHQPIYNGVKIVENTNKKLVSHGKNPTDYQAFMFGVHRALKVIQRDRAILQSNTYAQYKNLIKLKKHYNKNKNIKLFYAICGALTVYKDDIKHCTNKLDFDYLFNLNCLNKNQKESNQIINELNFFNTLRSIGVKRFLFSFFKYIQGKYK